MEEQKKNRHIKLNKARTKEEIQKDKEDRADITKNKNHAGQSS